MNAELRRNMITIGEFIVGMVDRAYTERDFDAFQKARRVEDGLRLIEDGGHLQPDSDVAQIVY